MGVYERQKNILSDSAAALFAESPSASGHPGGNHPDPGRGAAAACPQPLSRQAEAKRRHGKAPVPDYPCITRLDEDLALTGRAQSTIAEYIRYGRRIAAWSGRDPAVLAEEDVRAFLLHLKREAKYKPNSLRLVTAALRFLFRRVLGREWAVLALASAPDAHRLPVALTRQELARLFGCIRQEYVRMAFELMFGCGLRVGEVVKLAVRDIRGKGQPAQHLHIREAKGGTERLVPLPPTLYRRLRAFWDTHRHPVFLFPSKGWTHKARGAGTKDPAQAEAPISVSALQHAMGLVRREAGLPEGITCHTLRHSYATHSLEAGVNLRQLSAYLGHSSLEITARYLHLTQVSEATALAAIEGFTRELIKPAP